MAENRYRKGEQTKIRNVPIAVTPEGFWCCPSPVGFQKVLKNQALQNKSKPSLSPPHPPAPNAPSHKKQTPSTEKKPTKNPPKPVASDDSKSTSNGAPDQSEMPVSGERTPRNNMGSYPRKVSIEFGEPGTSDLKVVLFGKHEFSVKLDVHKDVIAENSSFFAEKLSEVESDVPCLRIDECEDVDIYVETIGLMYCKDMKQRLIKQSVQRVLRMLKVAEAIGFSSCIQSCLDYLEAAPWVGEDEEEKVVSSVLRLQVEGVGVNPVLKRVSSNIPNPPKDTLSHIVDLVLRSNEERGRREMKSIVLKLLREKNCSTSDRDKSPDICYEMIYSSCRSCLDSLLGHFRWATEPEINGRPIDDSKEPIAKQIALEADNLAWLLEILSERRVADEFAVMWATQNELAGLHQRLTTMVRYHVSCITSRLFVGIGRGEMLPSKETRQMLLETWLEPLINDYSWLNHGCRSFDRKVVEEGIGRTILTLPLDDQQSILLSWMGKFLKAGDNNCPNLQTAFEVWWRRTFIRPYGDPRVVTQDHSGNSITE